MTPFEHTDKFFSRPTVRVAYYGVVLLLSGLVAGLVSYMEVNGRVTANTDAVEETNERVTAHEKLDLHTGAVSISEYNKESDKVQTQLRDLESSVDRNIGELRKDIKKGNDKTTQIQIDVGIVKSGMKRVEDYINRNPQ